MPSTTTRSRFSCIAQKTNDTHDAFAYDVRRGLTGEPKSLPCQYLYDKLGSLLFEAICELPEYYLTGAERQILQTQAEEIAGLFDEDVTLVELGSGSASKTRLLIEAFLEQQETLRFVPMDISRSILEESSFRLLQKYRRLEISALACEYQHGLRRLDRVSESPRLVLWLGSSIGNFPRPQATAFLRDMLEQLAPEDQLLIGIDLKKDPRVLEAAYDDPQGVTAAFSLNLLKRINVELGGRFDLNRFSHQALFNEDRGRVDIGLVSREDQSVRIDGLEMEVAFAEGETIHTEKSCKYSLDEIDALAADVGLTLRRRLLDNQERFSLNLFERADA